MSAPRTFCPMCDNEAVEDFDAFGFNPGLPGRAEADPVLCEKHEAEAEDFAVECDMVFP